LYYAIKQIVFFISNYGQTIEPYRGQNSAIKKTSKSLSDLEA